MALSCRVFSCSTSSNWKHRSWGGRKGFWNYALFVKGPIIKILIKFSWHLEIGFVSFKMLFLKYSPEITVFRGKFIKAVEILEFCEIFLFWHRWFLIPLDQSKFMKQTFKCHESFDENPKKIREMWLYSGQSCVHFYVTDMNHWVFRCFCLRVFDFRLFFPICFPLRQNLKWLFFFTFYTETHTHTMCDYWIAIDIHLFHRWKH